MKKTVEDEEGLRNTASRGDTKDSNEMAASSQPPCPRQSRREKGSKPSKINLTAFLMFSVKTDRGRRQRNWRKAYVHTAVREST